MLHTCPQCGKEFRDRHPRHFCSRDCRRQSRSQRISPQGYLVLAGKLIHIVIAEAAIGHKLPDGCEVHHLDENKLNNTHANLVICENRKYHQLLHARQRIINAGGDPDMERFCCICKALRPIASFSACSGSYDGRSEKCRSCSAVLGKKYRLQNIEYYREYDRKKYLKKKLSRAS